MKKILLGLFLSLVTMASIFSFSTKSEADGFSCPAGKVYNVNSFGIQGCIPYAICQSYGVKCSPICTTGVWTGSTCTTPEYRCIRPDGSHFACATPATYFSCYNRQFYAGIWYHWACGVTPFGWRWLIPQIPIYRQPFAPPRFNPPPVYINPPRLLPRPPIVYWNPRGGYVVAPPHPYFTPPRFYVPRYYVPRYYTPNYRFR